MLKQSDWPGRAQRSAHLRAVSQKAVGVARPISENVRIYFRVLP